MLWMLLDCECSMIWLLGHIIHIWLLFLSQALGAPQGSLAERLDLGPLRIALALADLLVDDDVCFIEFMQCLVCVIALCCMLSALIHLGKCQLF